MKARTYLLALISIFLSLNTQAQLIPDEPEYFNFTDIFNLEYAANPDLSKDGSTVLFERHFANIMHDQIQSDIWMVKTGGQDIRPLVQEGSHNLEPTFSPDGSQFAYIAHEKSADYPYQIKIYWLDSHKSGTIAQLKNRPRGLVWSPNSQWLSFVQFVEEKKEPFVTLPQPPKGADWATPAIVVDKVLYRSDGQGYVKPGYNHIFITSVSGGLPQQITSGDFHHNPPVWTPDSQQLIFSASRQAEAEFNPLNTDIFKIDLNGKQLTQLTSQSGADDQPAVSPDGKRIAYSRFADEGLSYHVSEVWLMDINGKNKQALTNELDRSVRDIKWNANNRSLYFIYDDAGNTQLALADIEGKLRVLTRNIGGTTLGRPYDSGQYDVSPNGYFVTTQSRPDYPADLFLGHESLTLNQRLTYLNHDLLAKKTLSQVEEIRYPSSFDGQRIQGWIVTPPQFDPSKKYPLILEIHGGPHANYGDRFSAEMQLFSAAGYIVLYLNPRGSTSYGKDFANLINKKYPSEDYDDLISAVDYVIAKGYVDPNQLYVTGGSGGGVLTSWIIGKTNRFNAAVVAKPVINWFSFVLTADAYPYFQRYWFDRPPWEDAKQYLERSPISLVGNVQTPTMLLTGERDYRTPISESEQYYQALKLRKIDSVLVRIPDASHGIAARPSYLVSKVAHILQWFKNHSHQQ